MKTPSPENLLGKTITIDEGHKKLQNDKIAWRWNFTISDDGKSFDSGKIKYHELIYSIDKSVSMMGETETEKWIEIKKSDLANIPHVYSPLEIFVPQLNGYKKKGISILNEFKKDLKRININFEEGDWQSFS
tara:strand:- start:95 stop:490 length:396 start_codon:yes stop_codon:yes gene_type:complete